MSHVLSTVSDLDLTTTGVTSLYVSPSDKKTVIEYVVVRCTVANTVSDEATIGVRNGGSVVAEGRKAYGMTAVDKVVVFDTGVGGGNPLLAEDDQLQLDVTGATATAQEADIDVIGYTF